jgi:dihydrofolate reductase
MPKLVMVEFMSLDGVVQAPGDPRKDPDGFARGGWSRPFFRDHRRYLSTRQPATVLRGDVGVAVAELKRQPGRDILVVGSSQLAHALVRHDLVDEDQLWFHPIVLGTGKRLFPEQNRTTNLRLVETSTTTSGLVIVTYASIRDNGAAAA